jgi:glycerophosphoryl diester phosphodiesterase
MIWIGLAVVVLGLYVAAGLRRPVETREFFRSLPAVRPLVIAHRGGQYIFPENTLAAFTAAAKLGVDALEMDVHRTADGVPVVIHDETVDRTTDGTGRVEQFTLAELKRLDAGYRFSPPGREGEHPFRGTGVDIPTLREVFEALPHVPMIVEVKENDPELADAVVTLIREYDRADRTMPASFHHDILVRFRTSCPEAVTHASEREVVRFVVAAWLRLEGLVNPPYGAIMVPPRKGIIPVPSRRVLRAARKRNLFTAVWSIEDPAEMRVLAARGVDAWTTGRPDLAVEVRKEDLGSP